MHILAIGESTLQSKLNRLCSHKAQSRVDNDRFEDLVSAAPHETHPSGYFLRTKPSNEDYFFERRKFLNCWNAFGVAVLLQTL